MIYQDPLAYLVGLEGQALLDGWAGDHDRAFTQARLAEIRRLLDDAELRDRGVSAEWATSPVAYSYRADGYDREAGGGLFAIDEPVVAEYLGERAPGVALDAACGTGRFAEILFRRGHQVVGVDSSPDMLAFARRRVPDGDFRLGTLQQLPLPDDSVDVIVSALALVHVADLAPVLAEMARVLRPGGDLIISDIHPELVIIGSVIKARGSADQRYIVSTHRHPLGDYLRPALDLGLEVKRCEEPSPPVGPSDGSEPATTIGDWDDWPWSLMAYLPTVIPVAGRHPCLVIWHFRRPDVRRVLS